MSDERTKLTTRAALASVAVACFLLFLKAYAAWATGSVAMLGSLADTGLDVIASLITLSGVRIAAMPADRDHRFGHGKAESLAALIQVGIIGISAIGIGWRAVDRLIHGATTAHAEYGIAVSAIAIVATLGLILFQRSVIRRTGSVAIRTDSVHYSSDLLLNLSVIAALALDQYAGLAGADPVFGILIASLINLFLQSSGLAWAISFLGVLIFAGLTAYDTQRLKEQYAYVAGTDFAGKAVVLGALSLYLDFINMFQFLLQFMGDRR